jgi:hypothetical protein
LSWLLARLLLSAAALLAALAAALLAWLFIRVHNCSFVSSLPTTKPRPLSFLRTLVRKRTIRPVAHIPSSTNQSARKPIGLDILPMAQNSGGPAINRHRRLVEMVGENSLLDPEQARNKSLGAKIIHQV